MMEKLSAEEFDANYKNVRERLCTALQRSGRRAESVTLLAATKTVDPETINYAIRSGITHIGENRVQELLAKQNALLPAHRHFIGHLQTNKVKDIIDRVEMIESVDSVRLAEEISKHAAKTGKVMDILLEVNIGAEASKSGFMQEELENAALKIRELACLRIRGLMTIPPACAQPEDSRKYFQKMYKLFIDMRQKTLDNIDILSMGMSHDFDIAVEEGATLVRLGTALFGRRTTR